MGAARVLISLPFLREALCLPRDTDIRFVGMSGDCPDTAEVTLTHQDIKDVPFIEGQLPPIVTPLLQRDKEGQVTFLEWGQR